MGQNSIKAVLTVQFKIIYIGTFKKAKLIYKNLQDIV